MCASRSPSDNDRRLAWPSWESLATGGAGDNDDDDDDDEVSASPGLRASDSLSMTLVVPPAEAEQLASSNWKTTSEDQQHPPPLTMTCACQQTMYFCIIQNFFKIGYIDWETVVILCACSRCVVFDRGCFPIGWAFTLPFVDLSFAEVNKNK